MEGAGAQTEFLPRPGTVSFKRLLGGVRVLKERDLIIGQVIVFALGKAHGDAPRRKISAELRGPDVFEGRSKVHHLL